MKFALCVALSLSQWERYDASSTTHQLLKTINLNFIPSLHSQLTLPRCSGFSTEDSSDGAVITKPVSVAIAIFTIEAVCYIVRTKSFSLTATRLYKTHEELQAQSLQFIKNYGFSRGDIAEKVDEA